MISLFYLTKDDICSLPFLTGLFPRIPFTLAGGEIVGGAPLVRHHHPPPGFPGFMHPLSGFGPAGGGRPFPFPGGPHFLPTFKTERDTDQGDHNLNLLVLTKYYEIMKQRFIRYKFKIFGQVRYS
jgi:hypothetical protein